MPKSGVVLTWTPRIAGVAMSLFLGLFALDAFSGRPLLDAFPAFAIHLMPALVVLAAVALSWRFPLAGAVAFAALALGYGVMVHWRLDWIAVIAGPMVVIAALFTSSWAWGRRGRTIG